MDDSNRLGKLKWICRRGMKELDLILERFVDRQAEAIRLGAWPELESFLGTEDDRLWDWVQHPDSAPAEYQALLTVVCQRD